MSTNKKYYSNVLSEVTEMLNKVKNLNEAISFDENYDMEDKFESEEMPMDDDFSQEEPIADEKSCHGEECDMTDEATDIDTIREIALKGMLKYVKQSNSAEYETLKKIFQFCDKVNNDKNSVEEEK